MTSNESIRIQTSAATTAHRSECATIVIAEALKLTSRSRKTIDLATLKDLTGLTGADFVEALTGHLRSGHLVGSFRHNGRYHLVIDGHGINTLTLNL
jgi:hypothetical protein